MYYLVKKSNKSTTKLGSILPKKIVSPDNKLGALCLAPSESWEDNNFALKKSNVTGYEPFDASKQKRSGPVIKVADNFAVTEEFTITNKSSDELSKEKKLETELDISRLSTKEAVFIVIELMEKLLDKKTVALSDFSKSVQDAYSTLKTKVDEVK
jgi:hypothetical protein